MWWQWLMFGLIFLAIPFGLYGIKEYTAKRINPTEEQNKIANQRLTILCLFYWLCDFFYMTFIVDNLTWKFIFGGLIMIIIFYNLSKAFINGNRMFNFGLIQDFIVGIALTVYLIYIIPNPDLRNIIIPIISAVYGGLLTLVGVAWTIRKSDSDRKREEEQKAKPLVFVCDPKSTSVRSEDLIRGILHSNNTKGTLKKVSGNKIAYTLPHILIDNSDYSHVVIRGFRVNDDFHLYDYGQVLPKDEAIYLKSDFRFEYTDEINYVSIILQDMLENLHELVLNFTIVKDGKDKVIKINSGIETKKTTLNINPKEI